MFVLLSLGCRAQKSRKGKSRGGQTLFSNKAKPKSPDRKRNRRKSLSCSFRMHIYSWNSLIVEWTQSPARRRDAQMSRRANEWAEVRSVNEATDHGPSDSGKRKEWVMAFSFYAVTIDGRNLCRMLLAAPKLRSKRAKFRFEVGISLMQIACTK